MKNLVVFYTRTGTSRRVASEIAGEMGAEMVELLDPASYKGFFGFMKGGFYASSWRKVNYRVSKDVEIDESTHVYLVSPVWASRTAPAIYSFLMDQNIDRKSLVLTNLGSPPEKAYAMMEARFGSFDKKYCISKNKQNEEQIVQRIIDEASC